MKAMEPIAVLEAGTSRTRVFVGEEREGGGLEVTGVGESRSEGIQKGEVVHSEAAQRSIVEAVEEAQRLLEMDINDVYLAVNGAGVEGVMHREETSVEGVVEEEDIDRLSRLMPGNVGGAGRENVQTVGGGFWLDGLRVANPQGMTARTLALEALILHGQRTRLLNLIQTVKQAGLNVKSLLFSGVASAMSMLDAETRGQGVLAIDIGAGTTDFAAYASDRLADGGALPVGGQHVTNDISRAFRLTTAEAEELKRGEGNAMVCATQRTRRISLKGGAKVKATDLQTVIHLRMEEIFRLIRERLQRRNLLKYLGEGVVLTGGGARLTGVGELAEDVFGLPCRVGVPEQVGELGERYAQPEYSTGIGGLVCAYQREARQLVRRGTWVDRLRKFIGW